MQTGLQIGASAYGRRADEQNYGYEYGYSERSARWEPWIQFLQSLRQGKARLEAKIARELLMVERFPAPGFQILALAKAQGRITNAQIVEVTGANRNTVKKHLHMLVSASHLVRHCSGKATWYSRV